MSEPLCPTCNAQLTECDCPPPAYTASSPQSQPQRSEKLSSQTQNAPFQDYEPGTTREIQQQPQYQQPPFQQPQRSQYQQQSRFESQQPRYDSPQPRYDSPQPRYDSQQPRYDSQQQWQQQQYQNPQQYQQSQPSVVYQNNYYNDDSDYDISGRRGRRGRRALGGGRLGGCRYGGGGRHGFRRGDDVLISGLVTMGVSAAQDRNTRRP